MDSTDANTATLFFAGDVMTGRGIDQIQRHPGDPELRESVVRDARGYIELAEEAHGPVPTGVDPSYIWGDALEVLERIDPDASIVNLETSITAGGRFWPGKLIHYRMHPDNIDCLSVAGVDVCTLANNHVLDFGPEGLLETLEVLDAAGIEYAGAGRDIEEAARPARVELNREANLVVFSFATRSSGVPAPWAAGSGRPGVYLLEELSNSVADEVIELIGSQAGDDDIVVASIHWGSNWGWQVSRHQVRFAHRLLEEGVDILHGHSSHHVRPVEVYDRRLVLYGCGDLITDYEGIGGHEEFHGELGAMYLTTVTRNRGELVDLQLIPTRLEKMRLQRAGGDHTQQLETILNRISRRFETRFEQREDGSLRLASM